MKKSGCKMATMVVSLPQYDLLQESEKESEDVRVLCAFEIFSVLHLKVSPSHL